MEIKSRNCLYRAGYYEACRIIKRKPTDKKVNNQLIKSKQLTNKKSKLPTNKKINK